jgi:hypothetical protein
MLETIQKAYVNSLTDNHSCSRPSPEVNDSLGVFLRMEDTVRDENNVQDKVGRRDTEHDKCQHQH